MEITKAYQSHDIWRYRKGSHKVVEQVSGRPVAIKDTCAFDIGTPQLVGGLSRTGHVRNVNPGARRMKNEKFGVRGSGVCAV